MKERIKNNTNQFFKKELYILAFFLFSLYLLGHKSIIEMGVFSFCYLIFSLCVYCPVYNLYLEIKNTFSKN